MTNPHNLRPHGLPLDFKLRACLDYAHSSWSLHRNPKSPALKPIADFFRGRCARLRALMQLPAQIGNATIKMQEAFYSALFEITGGVTTAGLTEEQIGRIRSHWNERLAEIGAESERLRQTTAWDRHVYSQLVEGLVAAEVMASDVASLGAIQASMMSYLTTGWTIIETMSGDLWEATLNAHPSSLANLSGTPKRLKSQITSRSAPSSKESKIVPLDAIAEHGFDVANKMGTILRYRYDFASLDGIREAYASAFDKGAAQIDRALTDKALDALSAVRNVIVHRDALADSTYIKKAKFLKLIPIPNEGEHLLLNGEIVTSLLKPAVSAANQLLIAVDDWLVKYPS